MDFLSVRTWLEKKVGGDGYFDIGDIAVSRDLSGNLTIQTKTDTFGMERVPVEIFDKLAAGISAYRDIDSNEKQTDRTAAEQAAYDAIDIGSNPG